MSGYRGSSAMILLCLAGSRGGRGSLLAHPQRKIQAVAFWSAGRNRCLPCRLAGAAVLAQRLEAYLYGLAALALLIPVLAVDTVESISARQRSGRTALLDYSTATLVASVVALLWAAGAQWRLYGEAHSVTFGLNALELTAWSVLCHILVAILILSILNLILADGLENTPAGRSSGLCSRDYSFSDFVVRADPFSGKWAELPWLGGAAVRRFFRRGPNVAGLFAGPAVSPVPCGSPGKAGSAWAKPVSARS